MSKYNINGLICEFPACTTAQLTQYQPTPRTRLLAWVTPSSPVQNVAVISLLSAMYEIGALERPPYLIEEGRRMAYLLEYPNNSCMDNLTFWVRIFSGTKYTYLHPYAIARADMIHEADRTWEDIRYTKTRNGRRPLLDIERTHPEWGCSPLPLLPATDPYIANDTDPCKPRS